jgi:DNA ligase-4
MEFNTRSVRMLRIEDVLGVWDSTGFMGKLWRVRGEMDDVAREFEECVDEGSRWRALKPKLGSMIKVSNTWYGYLYALSNFSFFIVAKKRQGKELP